MFKRIDGILAGSFEGWVNAEDDTNTQGGEEGDGENLPTDEGSKGCNN